MNGWKQQQQQQPKFQCIVVVVVEKYELYMTRKKRKYFFLSAVSWAFLCCWSLLLRNRRPQTRQVFGICCDERVVCTAALGLPSSLRKLSQTQKFCLNYQPSTINQQLSTWYCCRDKNWTWAFTWNLASLKITMAIAKLK